MERGIGVAPFIPVVITLPNSPEQLYPLYEIDGFQNSTPISLPFLVPAGGSLEVTIPLPEGYSCNQRFLLITASYYGRIDPTTGEFIGVKIDYMEVDRPGNKVCENVPIDYPLGYPYFGFGTYYIKRKYIKIKFSNSYSEDITVGIKAMVCLMPEDEMERIKDYFLSLREVVREHAPKVRTAPSPP